MAEVSNISWVIDSEDLMKAIDLIPDIDIDMRMHTRIARNS